MEQLSKYDNTLDRKFRKNRVKKKQSPTFKSVDKYKMIDASRSKNRLGLFRGFISSIIPPNFWERIRSLSPEEQWIEMANYCERCGVWIGGKGGLCDKCQKEMDKKYLIKVSKYSTPTLKTCISQSNKNNMFKTELNLNDTDKI